MFTLRSLLAMTMVVAIVLGIWAMGHPLETTVSLTNEQKARTAVVTVVLTIVAMLCVLKWINEGERVRPMRQRWVAFSIDAIAFVSTCALMIVVFRLGANVLFR